MTVATREAGRPPRTEVDLQVADLSFGYRPGVPLVRGFDLRLGPGTVCTIGGPSGCGKSTILYLLGLMLTPWTGSVALTGEDLGRADDGVRSRERAQHVGFVFQDAVLDPAASIADNIAEAVQIKQGRVGSDDRARAERLLEELGVVLPPTARCGEVSGGQAQRIALCRALVTRPGLVLADEPTGNLDPASRDAVLAGLEAYASAGGVVVVVTHDPAVHERGHLRRWLDAAP